MKFDDNREQFGWFLPIMLTVLCVRLIFDLIKGEMVYVKNMENIQAVGVTLNFL